MRASLYWLLVALLLAFGLVGILSVGAPFLLLGVTLAVLSPVRKRPQVFWPALLAVMGFIVGYILVAPLSCITAASRFGATTETAYTTCSSPLGIRYTGGTSYNPPMWPALIAGLVVSFGAGALTRLAVKDRRRGSRAPTREPERAGGANP